MNLADLEQAAMGENLMVMGHLVAEPGDDLGVGTIVLLGPAEPGFWSHVSTSPEFSDGAPDPMDRWSRRVIEPLAKAFNATALFPFGTPPRPFIGWALRSGACFVSPAALLVHAKVGLFVSFRGAIFLPGTSLEPSSAPNPCDACADKPCLSACPPRATGRWRGPAPRSACRR